MFGECNYMDILYSLPGLLIAIVFHEVAHGYVAYTLGDDTAKNAGRLTLNPIKHIDPIGFFSMLIFKFGWAKPIPINSYNFKNRKKDMFLVSLAGPAINMLIAIITGVIIIKFNFNNIITKEILRYTFIYNIMLAAFNFMPFPPLDGSKMLASMLPNKAEYFFYKNEKYLSYILIILIMTGGIDKFLSPFLNLISNLIFKLINIF